jgi:hypothetical protein
MQALPSRAQAPDRQRSQKQGAYAACVRTSRARDTSQAHTTRPTPTDLSALRVITLQVEEDDSFNAKGAARVAAPEKEDHRADWRPPVVAASAEMSANT